MAKEKNLEELRTDRCPHCKEYIYAKASVCPFCREHIGWSWVLKPRISGPFFYYVISLAALCYAFVQNYEKNQAIADKTVAQNTATSALEQKNAIASDANKAGLAVNNNVPIVNLTGKSEDAFQASVLKNVDGTVKSALSLAFKLKKRGSIKFVWGGKTPDEGFDSSGFVTYVLFRVNMMDSMVYRDFSSQKLKDTFDVVEPQNAKAGDLAIFKSGLVLFYLGENKGLGIGNREGIKFYDVDLTKNCDIRKWEGEKVVAITDNQGHQVIENGGAGLFTIERK